MACAGRGRKSPGHAVRVLLSLRGAHGVIAPIAPGSSACLGLVVGIGLSLGV